MLEVHPPSEPVHGWRDFFIHLATITIGLLIALSLEGCVEFWHHRSLVHEAEAVCRLRSGPMPRNCRALWMTCAKNRSFCGGILK